MRHMSPPLHAFLWISIVCFQRYKQRETTQTPESQPVDKPCPSPRGELTERLPLFLARDDSFSIHLTGQKKEPLAIIMRATWLRRQLWKPCNHSRQIRSAAWRAVDAPPYTRTTGIIVFLLSHLSEIIASKRGRKPNNEHTQFMTYRYKEKGPPFISKSQQIHRDGLLAYFP